jgi:hypothetical protein
MRPWPGAARAQALLCAYVAGQPEGSLTAEQMTQLARAVRLAHLTPYFLAHVAPLVGWLCAGGRKDVVHGVGLARMGSPARSGTPAAWLPSAPARTVVLDPAARPVEWELPLAQLQPLVDRVAAGAKLEQLAGPGTAVAFGLDWGLVIQLRGASGAKPGSPGAGEIGLYLSSGFKHMPKPPADAKFRWAVWGGGLGPRLGGGAWLHGGRSPPCLLRLTRVGHSHVHPHHVCSFGDWLEMARHGGGAPLSRKGSLEASPVCGPTGSLGYACFVALPSGTVDDPALAPFLHPAVDGGGGKVLRLRGVATAME